MKRLIALSLLLASCHPVHAQDNVNLNASVHDHYKTVFDTASQYITNTLLYAGIAALLDVIIATSIAYIVWRTKIVGRKWLDYRATAALASTAGCKLKVSL